MGREFKESAHCVHLLVYHFVFVTKYRHPIFKNEQLTKRVKELIKKCCGIHFVEIEAMEIDPSKPDHIHLMLRLRPAQAPYEVVHDIKQYSTYYIWKEFSEYLKEYYWKEHHLWHRGYFVSTVGNVSASVLQRYIDEQGN